MIRYYINDIKKSLENECYFSALSLSLTLPDICGMAEFPNKDVGERYISWCDSYLIPFIYDDNKVLSGETIYNLRNTFLHQGSINIDKNKIKNDNNRIDKFILVIGESDIMLEFSADIQLAGKIIHRAEMINVSFLCSSICDCALNYYNDNKDRFSFDCYAIHVNDLFSDINIKNTDKKNAIKVHEIQNAIKDNSEFRKSIQDYINSVPIDTKMLEPELKDEKDKIIKANNTTKARNPKAKTSNNDKKESQVRSFFGQHFKKQFYKEHKEEIIKAILSSKTKEQLKAKLKETFNQNEVDSIYKRLQPLVDDILGLK